MSDVRGRALESTDVTLRNDRPTAAHWSAPTIDHPGRQAKFRQTNTCHSDHCICCCTTHSDAVANLGTDGAFAIILYKAGLVEGSDRIPVAKVGIGRHPRYVA